MERYDEEHAHHRVVVARVEVIKAGAIIVLPDEALRRVETARVVASVAVWPEELVTLHRGSTLGVIEGGDQAALRVAQVELRAVAVQRAKQAPCQEVVVHVLLVDSRPAVLVFLNAEGIGQDGGAAPIGETAQHALARGVVEVLLLVGGTGVPLGQVIQQVVLPLFVWEGEAASISSRPFSPDKNKREANDVYLLNWCMFSLSHPYINHR